MRILCHVLLVGGIWIGAYYLGRFVTEVVRDPNDGRWSKEGPNHLAQSIRNASNGTLAVPVLFFLWLVCVAITFLAGPIALLLLFCRMIIVICRREKTLESG